MKKLVLIGAGGFGREVKALVDEINEQNPTWDFLGYIDDGKTGKTIEGDPILGDLNYLLTMEEKPYVCIAIANVSTRKRIAKRCEEKNIPFATLIHPNVTIKGDLCTIGEGTILCDGVLLAIHTRLGKHCILNTRGSVGHDTAFGDFTSAMPEIHVAGDCVLGEGCYLGLRCTIINGIHVVDDCVFGAGSVVVKNVEQPGTYVGIPAKMIKPYVAE